MGQFLMPSLGADMEAGTLTEWMVKPGDSVARGDIVAVVETQKGAIEIEIFEGGTIESLLIDPGTTVPVGTPMAEVRGLTGSGAERPIAAPPPAEPVAPSAATPPPPLPAVPVPSKGAVLASPAARKLASDHGLDLTTLTGSGPDGAVVYVDVESALRSQAVGGPPPTVPSPPKAAETSAMRAAIAAAMARSKREIPHYYLEHTIDVSASLSWLAATNAERAPADRLLPGALFVKAVALALHGFPEFNGVHENSVFRPSEAIHVGVAIALRGGGLVAPAIHDTDTLSVDDLMKQLRDLTARVRAGRFRSSELSDPTITVSSLGDRGVEKLYAVIYPPQVAIIGLGKVVDRPVVVDGRVEARPTVTATLSADHRVSDGHRGALFLRKLEELLQEPEAI